MKISKDHREPHNSSCPMLTRLIPLLATLFLIQIAIPHADAEKFTRGTEQKPLAQDLKAGDYVWKPSVSRLASVTVGLLRATAMNKASRRFNCVTRAAPFSPVSGGRPVPGSRMKRARKPSRAL